MIAPPPDPSEKSTEGPSADRRRLDRLLHAGTALAAVAMALAALTLYEHARLSKAGDDYTSFCNIGSTVNCSQVLGSTFASLLGVPVGWLALAAYAAIAALLQVAVRAGTEQARRALRIACIAVYASAAFSLYMAYVSFYVIGAVCLMCSGLYVIAIALAWIAWLIPARFVASGRGSSAPLSAVGAATTLALSLAAIAVARVAWPTAGEQACRPMTVDAIRRQAPDFYRWYSGLRVVEPPVVDRHALGSSDAPVTIVEFFDFECGYCRRNHDALKSLVARHPDDVRVVYRHFPLDASCNEALEESIHSRACRAAEAAECAALQGRFADMADAMFIRQRQLFETNLLRIAERLGLDMAAFERCMDEHETLSLILDDCRAGQRLELRSTPTLFINGREVVGSISEPCGYDHAISIERETASAKSSPAR